MQLSSLPPTSENSSGSHVSVEDRSEATDTHQNTERHSPQINVASNVHGPNNDIQLPPQSNNESPSPQVDATLENRTLHSSENEVQVPVSSEEHPQRVAVDIHENGKLHEDEAINIRRQECRIHTQENNTQPPSQHNDKLTLGFSKPGLDLSHE